MTLSWLTRSALKPLFWSRAVAADTELSAAYVAAVITAAPPSAISTAPPMPSGTSVALADDGAKRCARAPMLRSLVRIVGVLAAKSAPSAGPSTIYFSNAET